jgi:DNA-binding transcriptional MerR regulator
LSDISKDFLSWKERTEQKKLPSWQEIPDIGLYMDQVIRLMEDYLSAFESADESDKLITPSMINNYVKMGIIPPPEKKKYNRLHIALLIVVCVLKQIISIADVKAVLEIKLKSSEASVCYDSFREIVNASTSSVFAIVDELTGGIDKFIEGNDLIDIAVLVSVFSNVGKSVSQKIISLETASTPLPVSKEEKKAEKKAEKKQKSKE